MAASAPMATSTQAVEDVEVLAAAATPRWLVVPGRILLIGLGVSTLALAVLPWQQASHGTGQVVAFAPTDRPQEIHAPLHGRVAAWHVQEGSVVEEGDLLVELVDVDPEYLPRLEQKRRAVEDALAAAEERERAYQRQEDAYEEARVKKLRAAELKIAMAAQKIAALDEEVRAAEAAVITTEQNLKRRRSLFAEGLVSDRDLELEELAYTQSLAARRRAEAKRLEAEAERSALEAERLQVGSEELGKIASAHAEVRKARSDVAKAREELIQLDVALARQRSSTVKAPTGGVVLWVNGHLGGNLVKAGEPLVVLVPDDVEHAVELFIDGNDVPLVQVGRQVRLQFEGWPAVQFSGWPQVAVGTFGGEVAFVDATSRKAGRFRVVVRPDPDDEPWPAGVYLRQGVRAHGWVLLDEVALGFELWRRLNGFPPSVDDPPTTTADAPSPLSEAGDEKS